MRILLYNPDNGVTRNFMPHLWMFLLQALTPAGHEVVLIDGNAQPMDEAGIARVGVELFTWIHEGLHGQPMPAKQLANKAAYWLAVCPAGEDVIGPFLTDRKAFLKDTVRPLTEKPVLGASAPLSFDCPSARLNVLPPL